MSQAEVVAPIDLCTVDPKSVPIEAIDIAQPELFAKRKHWAYFERLRKEDPVHYSVSEEFGGYWSVTRYEDILHVDTNHKIFSSEPTIVLPDLEEDFAPEMFIAMDQPKHDVQRKVVSPAVAPPALADLEDLIRERVGKVLDSLPVGETFNWVDKVSIEITTQMLATLFDFPFEERRKLTFWSDVTTAGPDGGDTGLDEDERRAELLVCLETFSKLLAERAQLPPSRDFISMMAHDPQMSKQQPFELLGNLMLLIVGGNDTTRNSMSGGVLALNQFPAEYAKLKADPSLIPNMVSEIIRWQTPLAYMRRTALEDTELGGKKIKKGDKLAMWYVSGNRDETAIDRANEFLIDRPNARKHLSFGFGIHRCMGNRLAEMQIRILWEEILKRFDKVEVVGEPTYAKSVFVHGITNLPVRLHPL
ncbi:MAG: cytochrome P450 [Alphaproteobacteria bacterium]|jgi:cytochrome P450|nr:cytochrome P450 [Alphaproteobacteria bacterium]MBO6629662.1 cytochrome P450 [Alphaproteobacteria bacterium]MDF1626889.1 cytochrome P450 [Parvibaculaceae bacterium]